MTSISTPNGPSRRYSAINSCYKLLLVGDLLCCVIVRLFIAAKYNSLANKIERVRAAAEATMGRDKAVEARDRGDGGVVISGVVEHKVTQL